MINLSSRIIITGASGYIWSNLVKRLIELGASQIYPLSYSQRGDIHWISPYICDLGDSDSVTSLFREIRPEYVIHLAASWAKFSQSQNFSHDYLDVNVRGVRHILNVLKSIGSCKWFLNISSLYEYGLHDGLITEETLPMPQTLYAKSKFIAMQLLQKEQLENNFPSVTYRLSSVYWPKDSNRIIPLLLDAFLKHSELKLFDFHKKRDFIYIDNVIWAILEFDKVLKKHIKVLNISTSESFSPFELVWIIAKALDLPIPSNIHFLQSSSAQAQDWMTNNSLYARILKHSVISFEQWILQVIQDYKS